MIHCSFHSNRDARAFSLIEVLIAILVLAIGMLGLGAVFPAVIAEQRDAFSVIEGENTASAAEALITNREFINFSLIGDDFGRPALTTGTPQERYAYEWVVPQFGADYYGWLSRIPGFYDYPSRRANEFQGSESGLWSFSTNRTITDGGTPPLVLAQEFSEIPVSARLFPQPYSGKDPKYVWDLALRREPSGDRLQAAIFVRRIDARLRVPRGFSLSDVLTDGGRTSLPGGNGPLLPVALNRNTGQPAADDGTNNMVYAGIQMLEVEVYPEHLDWLVIPNARNGFFDTSAGFAAQVGQKLLDNTGVVRTVVGLPAVDASDPIFAQVSGNSRVIQVEPPFEFQQAGGFTTDSARSNSGNITDPSFDDERASVVRQIVFTPRTPVAVRLVTLEVSP
jgi:prepilin-type N-terminal cleavage/methylation domain-containing protein